MARYDISPQRYYSPRGVPLTIWIRSDSNDHNTANASATEDEYHLRERYVSGLALDVGGYLGTVAISLVVDNPDLRVICVEPVPDNAALIRRNCEANGVADRVTVVEGLAGKSGTGTIRYAFQGNETNLHHAFVGNSTLAVPEAEHTALVVPSYSLADLVGDEPVGLLKIDCEGGEYAFFDGADLSNVQTIVGERHPNPPEGGHRTREDFTALLSATHDVTYTGPEAGPEGFTAERR